MQSSFFKRTLRDFFAHSIEENFTGDTSVFDRFDRHICRSPRELAEPERNLSTDESVETGCRYLPARMRGHCRGNPMEDAVGEPRYQTKLVSNGPARSYRTIF